MLKIWTVKSILMSSQTETRNMVLETGGKAILVINWQKSWLNFEFQCRALLLPPGAAWEGIGDKPWRPLCGVQRAQAM